MAVGARQNFQFFKQKLWFLENNRALSKFSYGILHYQIRSSYIHKFYYQIIIKSVHKKTFLC